MNDFDAPQVGHLVDRYTKSTPLVYDYAVGGNTIGDISDQIEQFISVGPGNKDLELSWNPATSIFGPPFFFREIDSNSSLNLVTWIGFNDVANSRLSKRSCTFLSGHLKNLSLGVEDTVGRLMQFEEKLYEAGARNFLFLNVPPLPKSGSSDPPHLPRKTLTTEDKMYPSKTEKGPANSSTQHSNPKSKPSPKRTKAWKSSYGTLRGCLGT